MSLRRLPEIVSGDDVVMWALRDDALDRWMPRAASDGGNVISILDVIGEWDGGGITSRRVAAALRKIGPGDVIVEIDSPGGSFFDGVAIYNMLREHDGAVEVRVLGLAASAASVIAMAGDTIKIGRSAFMMIHNAWGVCVGNRHEMEEVAQVLGQFDASMRDVYAHRSGIDASRISRLMDDETWMSGEEAIKAGLADEYLPSDMERSSYASASGAQAPDHVRARVRIENALIKEGMTRRERRALLSSYRSGMPGAAADVMPGADDWLKDAKHLLSIMQS